MVSHHFQRRPGSGDAYLNLKGNEKEELPWCFIRLAMLSVADYCIIPIQDYLGLDGKARINQPATLGKNWKWRLTKNQITPALLKRIRELTELSGRLHN